MCLKEFNLQFKINNDFILLHKRILPLLFSSFFSKSDILIDRSLLSNLSVGVISSFHYSQLFVNSGLSVITKGLSVVSLTKLSRLNKVSDREFFQYLYLLLKCLFVFLIYVQFSLIFNSAEILNFIFSFVVYDLDVTFISKTIIYLSGMFIGGALSAVLVNAYYVRGLNSFVAKISISLHILGLVAKILLFNMYGFYAIPIVFSIKSIVNCLILFTYLNFISKYRLVEIDFRYLFKVVCFIAVLIANLKVCILFEFNFMINIFISLMLFNIFYLREFLIMLKKMN